ncbi:hypothetical protein LUZ62_072501 [Rhynchospora pubera]|uniref:Uncharacterized protein n=1 Tax=Rhynchospora pubera TaxID=906938 RepID=A0AAV8D3Y7_9POAL|nr:hypothetical protein LUZ62_072501 [Rhynchospora pubera]
MESWCGRCFALVMGKRRTESLKALNAKNLKLCGAIPETPTEIRKVSKRIPLQELNGSDQSQSGFAVALHRVSRTTSPLILIGWFIFYGPTNLGYMHGAPFGSQFDQSPNSAHTLSKRIPLQEHNGSDQSPNSAHTSSNKKTQLYALCEQENTPAQEIIGTPGLEKENPASRQNTPETGSVEEVKCGKLDLTPVRHGKVIRHSLTNSPFPTPITLNDNMQTPATIYSSYPEAPATGKWARIRTQYAYPAVKPARREEITSGNKPVVVKENEVAGRGFSLRAESCEETPTILVSGSSEQLKTVTALRGRNGIPNTTTKYKEDQRVKWHSTPFKERLERILSDEKMLPPRKPYLRVAD